MALGLIAASVPGAIVTAGWAWPHGWQVALLSAPLGSSSLMLVAALAIYIAGEDMTR